MILLGTHTPLLNRPRIDIGKVDFSPYNEKGTPAVTHLSIPETLK